MAGRAVPARRRLGRRGTNFSIFSEHADGVELCLFDDDDVETRVEVTQCTAHNWHCYVPDIGPGQRYGYRFHGPYAPLEGKRFNPAKLLIDPYARRSTVSSTSRTTRTCCHTSRPARTTPTSSSTTRRRGRDAEGVVIDRAFDWGRPAAAVPWPTRSSTSARQGLHDAAPGCARRPARHLPRARVREADRPPPELGVTAIELLPVHHGSTSP